MTVTGPSDNVARFAAAHELLHREDLGSAYARVTVAGRLEAGDRAKADELGLGLEPVSLQQLVVLTTGHTLRSNENSEESR